MTSSDRRPPVVEAKPDGDAPHDVTSRALAQRIRQQEILAELGVLSLQRTPLQKLLDQTARLVAEGLHAEYSKVLRYLPDEKRLLVQAGVGWPPGVVGKASIGADLASPAGFALRTGKAVISNHLENEERFLTPELLVQNNVRRAMNVIVQGDGTPFGVLEVDSRSEGDFVPQDIAFLQGAANVVGMAIERQRHEQKLKAALERQRVLMGELNHRVMNSLSIVSSFLSLQARHNSGDVQRHLQEAAARVATVARAHDRLYKTSEVEKIELGSYIKAVCADLPSSQTARLIVEAPTGISISADAAISIALIIVELVTNSLKHAYADAAGNIWVTLAMLDDGALVASVRDEGAGLPADFAPQKSNGLGMRLVKSLAGSLDATLTLERPEQGVSFILRVPLRKRHD